MCKINQLLTLIFTVCLHLQSCRTCCFFQLWHQTQLVTTAFNYIKMASRSWKAEANTHTHTRLTALFPGLPGWAGTRKVKPIWIWLKQETVSGSGISWAISKSASRSIQITTPVPHHSTFFTGRMPFLPPNQQRQSTEGKYSVDKQLHKRWTQQAIAKFAKEQKTKFRLNYIKKLEGKYSLESTDPRESEICALPQPLPYLMPIPPNTLFYNK